MDELNSYIFARKRILQRYIAKEMNDTYYEPYSNLYFCCRLPFRCVYYFMKLIFVLLEVVFYICYTVLLLIQFAIFCVYCAVALVFLNLYDLYCYICFKLFVMGMPLYFELNESFAKKNKVYYEDIKNVERNWKRFAKMMKRYRSLLLFFIFVSTPIIIYEAVPQWQFHYDGGFLFADDTYYNIASAALLSLFGVGEWCDQLYNSREDLDILIEPYLSNAKVMNNDFIDNMSYIQVLDFIAKQGFVILQTDDKRVKVLLHQLPPNIFKLLLKDKKECLDTSYDATRLYEMETYMKIMIREGQLIHGDHILVVNNKYARGDEEEEESNANETSETHTTASPLSHPTSSPHSHSQSSLSPIRTFTDASRDTPPPRVFYKHKSDAELAKSAHNHGNFSPSVAAPVESNQDKEDREEVKYRVIVQKMVIWPWTFMHELKRKHPKRYPTLGHRFQAFRKVFYSKLWANDAQCRLMRTFVILFAMYYAMDELACCRMIPSKQTFWLVTAFLVVFSIYFFIVCGLVNVCTSYHAFLYEEKSGEVIKLFNNSYIREQNRIKVPIHLFEHVCNITPIMLENVVLSVRSCINYNPFDKGGFRFMDIIHLLNELCKRNAKMHMLVRVEVKQTVGPDDHEHCFEIEHRSLELDPDNKIPTLYVLINTETQTMRINNKNEVSAKGSIADPPSVKSGSVSGSSAAGSTNTATSTKTAWLPHINRKIERVPLQTFVIRILNDEMVISRIYITKIIQERGAATPFIPAQMYRDDSDDDDYEGEATEPEVVDNSFWDASRQSRNGLNTALVGDGNGGKKQNDWCCC